MAKKLSQGVVLTALHRGAKIIKTIVNEPPSKRGVFYTLTDGRPVNSELLERLVQDGLIQESADGLDLFGGNSQSYEIARNL